LIILESPRRCQGYQVQFLFAGHTLDTDRRELRRGLEPIAVEPQVFDLLIYLVENRDRVVSKDDLIASVWGGRIVSDSTLTSRVNAARKAVGDNGVDQKLIRTIARKGLRFVGVVRAQSSIDNPAYRGPGPNEVRETVRPALPLPDRPAIAVLPFTNMSGDPEQEYFSDGISEDIITALSKLRWFFVIARNSSFVYKGKPVHMKQIAEELGVGYVVQGSVRKGGDRVRITAQLNDVATGSHIWADHYDRSLADVFAVQDEITEAIVAAIEPQIYSAENFRAQRKPPDSMDAWDLVMRALSHYWRVTRQDNLVAQALLEKAIAFDPNYGQALGLLAASHTLRIGLRLFVRTALRRLPGRVRIGASAQSKLLTYARVLRPDAVLLPAMGGRRRGRAPCAAAEPARSVCSDILRHCLLRPVRRT
jgi:TolB-like protein